jgi:hypothetical protein
MYKKETQINCVNDKEKKKKQLPENTKVKVKDEINDERGTRFTLIGVSPSFNRFLSNISISSFGISIYKL